MKKQIVFFIFPTLLMFGCETKEPEITQTVDWYSSHEKERAEVLGKCRNNPGELAITPNCQNAVVAERKKSTATPNLRF